VYILFSVRNPARFYLSRYKVVTKRWRIDYNTERPHSSLENLTPEEFIRQEKEKIAAAGAAVTISNGAKNSNS